MVELTRFMIVFYLKDKSWVNPHGCKKWDITVVLLKLKKSIAYFDTYYSIKYYVFEKCMDSKTNLLISRA